MNNKAAELPMNFIVIAAIAVIVLIIVIMFLMSGFRTEAIDSQTVANSCAANCFAKQRSVAMQPFSSSQFNWNYCATMNVKGMSGDVDCSDLSSCNLEFSDRICTVSCVSDGKAICRP